MESDPALFMANLFLHYCENKHLLDSNNIDLQKVHLSVSVYKHFLKIFVPFKNHLEFNKNCNVIDPAELELKKKNISTFEASFLNLSLFYILYVTFGH